MSDSENSGLREMLLKKVSILDEAREIVYGRGEESYGHPRHNMQETATMWTSYLHARGLIPRTAELSAHDVAVMMILLKVAREGTQSKRDNLVDIVGYTLVAERLKE